jgi:hypothetical protein
VKARLYYILVEGSCHRSHFHLVEFEVLFGTIWAFLECYIVLKVCVAEIKGGRLATPERCLTPTAVLGVQRRHFGKFAARSR